MTDDEPGQWTKAAWRAAAEKWILEGLAARGLKPAGSLDQIHVKSWGTIIRVPTETGDVYFKATTLKLPHETAVTELLSNAFPEMLPELIKADRERNWLLLADGGPRLRDAFKDGLEIEAWSPILAAYAGLQIEFSGERLKEMVMLGAPDRRLAVLPQLYEELLTDREWLLIGQDNGLSQEEYERLRAGQGYIERLCRELEAFGVPAAMHHGDLHDGNVLFENGRFLFFDWGDSQVTHPFFSLRTVFVSMENTFGYEEEDPRFDYFAQDYLRAWSAFGDEGGLWEAFQIARRLWAIPTVLQWKLVMSRLESLRREMDFAVPSLLQELLQGNPEM